jgi:hypothetical protein
MDPIAMRQNQVPAGYQVPGRFSWLELRSGEYWSVNSVSILDCRDLPSSSLKHGNRQPVLLGP